MSEQDILANDTVKARVSGAPLLTADAVYRAISWRLMPLLIPLFLLAWIDRVNIGFAKLVMLNDLGFSEYVYGLGAGIFFIGYFFFEVPSNLLLHRIGARKTLARIAILWGLTTIATAFVTTATQFYILRFLLGAFEAGLVPGGVLYLTYWYPSHRRAQMVGLFIASSAIAGILGGPLAGWIMGTFAESGVFKSWQWLFILEGIPSVLLGGIILFALPSKPETSAWLKIGEKELVLADLKRDREMAGKRQESFLDSLKNPRIWLLSFIFFCLVGGNLALAFYSPSIIKGLGINNVSHIGLLSAIPYIAAAISMVLYGRHSDRKNERRHHFAFAALVGGGALIILGLLTNPLMSIVALIIAQSAILSGFAVFWEIPLLVVTGAAAAGCIALINSLGNLSGFVGPYIIGTAKTLTGSYAAGLYCMGALELLACIMVLTLVPAGSARR